MKTLSEISDSKSRPQQPLPYQTLRDCLLLTHNLATSLKSPSQVRDLHRLQLRLLSLILMCFPQFFCLEDLQEHRLVSDQLRDSQQEQDLSLPDSLHQSFDPDRSLV